LKTPPDYSSASLTRGYPLRGRLADLRLLHVGTSRIIYQLADNEDTVRVAAIRHRSIAYRTHCR
jgi:mRNA-degrading endonuclease RelE of RelBE toxin-antitoxin system